MKDFACKSTKEAAKNVLQFLLIWRKSLHVSWRMKYFPNYSVYLWSEIWKQWSIRVWILDSVSEHCRNYKNLHVNLNQKKISDLSGTSWCTLAWCGGQGWLHFDSGWGEEGVTLWCLHVISVIVVVSLVSMSTSEIVRDTNIPFSLMIWKYIK